MYLNVIDAFIPAYRVAPVSLATSSQLIIGLVKERSRVQKTKTIFPNNDLKIYFSYSKQEKQSVSSKKVKICVHDQCLISHIIFVRTG